MNVDLQRMLDLSRLDASLRGIAERRREREATVRAAEESLADAESLISTKHEEAKAVLRDADRLNLDVKSSEVELRKLEDQRAGAKSNKEYEILSKQIQAAEEKRGGLEDEVLERFERADALAAEERAGKARAEEARRALEEARRAAAAAEAEIAQEEARLKSERGSTAELLDPEDRRLYEKLLEQRVDSAVAMVVDGSCQCCARKITPQMENLLDIGKDIVQCMSCRRILFLDEGNLTP
jgi:predicted  nucleic acid-binding Zn-ribbon protein